MSSASAFADYLLPEGSGEHRALDPFGLTTHLVIGERKLRTFIAEIRELRVRCGQQDDLTTDPQYFIAANTQKNRRVAAVLIRRNHMLEAYVLFFEHCRFGLGLGFLRGGDGVGDGIVVGPEALRMEYVDFATRALLEHWRIHGVSLALKAPLDQSIAILGPKSKYRLFSGKDVQHKLPLESTYGGLLAGMGPRTRRSLEGKRKRLEKSMQITFVSSLPPSQALQAMLKLRERSLPQRAGGFYHARCRLHHQSPGFFCMGLLLPDGAWLSVLSGWRRNQVTYIDLQMNDTHFKRESLSAVMRAFMLEHEIQRKQKLINFVGGTSLLLRRYCQPIEARTTIFLSRPCLRTSFFRLLVPYLKSDSVYKRIMAGTSDQNADPRNSNDSHQSGLEPL